MAGFFRRIEKKYAWGFIGFLLSILFGAFGLYSIFHEKQPSVLFDITSEANVLDVRQPLKDLAISFQGQDIQQKNLNIRIFTVRIENNGEVDILQSHYDQNEVWGASVDSGKIIEARLTNTNSEYLRSNLNAHLINETTIQLNKTIFERGKFFTLEVLVLHDKDILPQIMPIGKIAGIDKIGTIKSWVEKDKQTFLTQLL